jgi:putative ABC transport system permease protein
MSGLHYYHEALINLTAAKLRSFLAVLGILVGTASVVALIGCGQLATKKALAQFKALGTDLLAVSLYQRTEDKSKSGDAYLTINQWEAISARIPYIIKAAPYGSAYQPLSFNGTVLQGTIIGADDALADIIHIHLAKGHFVSFVTSFEHFCVIGDGVAQQITHMSMDSPIGKQLRIGQYLYTIIGIASHWKENSFFNEDINQSVIIPIAGMSLVNKDTKISNAVLKLKPNSPINDVIEDIRQLVSSEAPKLSIFSRSAQQIISSMENQGHIFTLLLGVIGCISLLVGGIGIMNVMLVSVSERKKEIGIRKAVGAKNSDIQALFLAESVMLSLSGGVFGVLLGLIFTRGVAYFSNWSFSMDLYAPIAGFLVSAATGVFFGFYPARRAALLEPMVSLRNE